MKNNEILMAWNQPGKGSSNEGNNKNNPWGGRPRPSGSGGGGPPDLEQMIKKWIQKAKAAFNQKSEDSSGGSSGNLGGSGRGSFGGGTSSGRRGWNSVSWGTFQEFKMLALLVLGLLLVLYILGGIYIVEPPERAIITRFGKYVRTVGPGPHWIPLFIESREIVNVQRVATTDHSGLMLTKDRNIASVGIAVQYRIGDDPNDLRAYLFNVVNPIHSLKQSAESAMRQVVGQATMDEVLTLKRSEVAEAIKEQLVKTLKNYNTGILVTDVALQFAKAPDEVRAAFDDVIKAAADEERLINLARAYESEVIPKAMGTVERLKNEALSYQQEKVLLAQGTVQRFNAMLPEYQRSPKLVQNRLYLDALEEILSKTTKVIVDSGGSNNLIYLPLDKIMSLKKPQESSELTQTADNNTTAAQSSAQNGG